MATKTQLPLGHYRKSGIYMLKNINNGKFYIGSSNNIGKRWSQHSRELETNKHYCAYLQRAYNKYGPESFIFGVIEFTKDLKNREQYFLDLLNPHYNTSKFAYGGMRGKKLSKNHIKALVKANKGRKHTEAHKEKIRIAKIGIVYPLNFWKNSVAVRQKKVKVWITDLEYKVFNTTSDVVKYFNLENKNRTYVNSACSGRHRLIGLKAEYYYD